MPFDPKTGNLSPLTSNTRVFYACQAVAIEAVGENRTNSNNPTRIENAAIHRKIAHGVQSVGINSNFNLEQVFELGQIYIYENIEGIPEVEITMEKVLDNHYLLWQLATNGVSLSIPAVPLDKRSTLLARSRERCNVFLGVFKETEETIRSATNLQEIEIWCTGMYINNISYTFPTDGNCTESITLVGNHKSWSTNQNIKAIASAQFGNNVNGGYVDVPATGTQTGIGGTASFGGVARRENVRIQNCRFPDIIPGAARGSQPTTFNACKIQSISISCDLGREDVFVLGRKMPYIRTANYPVEVTCEIEVLSGNADSINVGESLDSQNRIIDTYSVLDYPLVIVMDNGLKFDLGYVKLSSVSYSGADAGGGNGATTYSFTGYNVLDIAGGPFTSTPGNV